MKPPSTRCLLLVFLSTFAYLAIVGQREYVLLSLLEIKKIPSITASYRGYTMWKHPHRVDGKIENDNGTIVTELKVSVKRPVTRRVPLFVGLPDSNFRSPYHKYWETNCSLVFKQNMTVIGATTELLKQFRVNNGDLLPVPSDDQFTRYTHNCSEFKRLRRYPERPLSDEERDYPVAYIITIHKDVAQVERLLRAIYQPQNIYCVHPDAKQPLTFQNSIRSLVTCFENVFISSRIEHVQYAGFTRLRADINCMEDLLETPVNWRYVINLCGQDFPLKTNLEIVWQLKANLGHNYINCFVPTHSKRLRTRYHHIWHRTGFIRTSKKKTPPPFNFTIYAGSAYYACTRAFVEYVIKDHRAIALLKWSEDTETPDEHYWATLQAYPGVPGGSPDAPKSGERFRLVVWNNWNTPNNCIGKYVRAICVFGMGYLKYLLSDARLFANKFHYDYDPVTLQCLEEMLDYRHQFPEYIHQLIPEFPVKNIACDDVP